MKIASPSDMSSMERNSFCPNSPDDLNPLSRLKKRLADSLTNFTKVTQLPAVLVESSDPFSSSVSEHRICKKELSFSNSATKCLKWHAKIRKSADQPDPSCGAICHKGIFFISYPFKIKESVLWFVEIGPVTLTKKSLCEAGLQILKPTLIALQDEFNLQLDLTHTAMPPPVKKVCDHIRANISNPISQETLSRITSLSSGHFARIFRQSTGMTIAKYISQQRVNFASERLLRDHYLRISEIALESGFESIPHFNREFRRHKGTSPTMFKKQLSSNLGAKLKNAKTKRSDTIENVRKSIPTR